MQTRLFGSTNQRRPGDWPGTWYSKKGHSRLCGRRSAHRNRSWDDPYSIRRKMYLSGEAEEWSPRPSARDAMRSSWYRKSPAEASRKGTVGRVRGLACPSPDRTIWIAISSTGARTLTRLPRDDRGLRQVAARGKILSWGVSNFDVPASRAHRFASGRGPVCDQVLYHIQERAGGARL